MPIAQVMTVALALNDLAYEALCEGGAPDASNVSLQLECAVRIYLLDRDACSPGWNLSDFDLGAAEAATATYEVEIDPTLWGSLTQEAVRQSVEPLRLLNHAALYYGALADSGALTRRIIHEMQEASR
jgi:hypothetical protein